MKFSDRRIILGVCAMDKKARSKPMQEILARLPENMFDILIFGNDCILYEPVENWPIVECLISFYSDGFPLHKAIEYSELRKPYLINDLKMQYNLQDRRTVYRILEANNIAVPRHVFVERDVPGITNIIEDYDEYIVVNGIQLNKPLVEKPVNADDHNIYIYYPMSAGGGSKRLFRKVADRSSEFYPKINEIRREGSYVYEEFINTQGIDVKVYTVGPNYGHAQARKSPVVDGKVMRDANGKEMHLPVILTPQEKEFSMKITRAFKQTVCGFDLLRVPGKSYVCDVNGWSFVKSSKKYYADCARVLNDMMLIALRTQHNPTISSQPIRRKNGSNREYLGRCNSSPLPDIHNTSPNSRYKLERLNIEAGSNNDNDNNNNNNITVVDDEFSEVIDNIALEDTEDSEEEEELLCVISVIRHGDRTPKQKIKIKLNESSFLDFYHRHSKSPTSNIKLKSKISLLEFLSITKEKIIELENLHINFKSDNTCNCNSKIIDTINGDNTTQNNNNNNNNNNINNNNLQEKEKEKKKDKIKNVSQEYEYYTKLCCIRDVLEDREINGLTRKIQLKPEKWTESSNPLVEEFNLLPTRATELLCIVKWGGDLTPLGEQQAESVGEKFRQTMYPDPSGGGILRLHSTFRHDLKIKASDEGRVMKTAAAFTKGLLELEGDLTPVLVSLVTVQEKNNQMLDNHDNNEVKSDLDYCKSYLNRVLQLDRSITPDTINNFLPDCDAVMKENLLKLGNPRQRLTRMHLLIKEVCENVQRLCNNNSHNNSTSSLILTSSSLITTDNNDNKVPYLNETYILMLDRWVKLDNGFFKHKEDLYDLTKVPELHDMARYDVLHNYHLGISCLDELFGISKLFADCVVPQEYGISQNEKRNIGRKMCHALLHKIQYDLQVAQSGTYVDMQYMLDESHGDELNIRTMNRCVRTRLYFTSESHIYTLFHVLGYSSIDQQNGLFNPDIERMNHNACELSYLSQITIRLFENKTKINKDKYRCEILLSPGAVSDPCIDKTGEIAPNIILNNSMSCSDLINYLNEAITGYELTNKLPRATSDNDNEMMLNS